MALFNVSAIAAGIQLVRVCFGLCGRAFFIVSSSCASRRSRELAQGRSHASRSLTRRQCSLQISEPKRTGRRSSSPGGGRICLRRFARREMELPHLCSKTRRFASGRLSMAWKPRRRTAGSSTKSCHCSHAFLQEPQVLNGWCPFFPPSSAPVTGASYVLSGWSNS